MQRRTVTNAPGTIGLRGGARTAQEAVPAQGLKRDRGRRQPMAGPRATAGCFHDPVHRSDEPNQCSLFDLRRGQRRRIRATGCENSARSVSASEMGGPEAMVAVLAIAEWGDGYSDHSRHGLAHPWALSPQGATDNGGQLPIDPSYGARLCPHTSPRLLPSASHLPSARHQESRRCQRWPPLSQLNPCALAPERRRPA